jgi:D-alanyl-D-alanine carboxypeptidase/D-alanyl-D-alanine-endopeptidase (penicillin-binding protein 4)
MRRGWVVVVAALLGACSGPAATTVGPPAPVTSLAAVVSLLPPPPTAAPPRPDRVRQEPWMRSLDRLIGDRPVSVSVEARGVRIYGHLPRVPRTPASNEKLLLSMAMLDRFGPGYRIATEAAGSARVRDGVLEGDLVLVGHGDPELGAGDLQQLAARLHEAGLRRVTGSVIGDTSAFRRDREAPGWHPIALRYIGLPTALSFEGNVDANGFVFDPERSAAAALAGDLRAVGIHVDGGSRSGVAPSGLRAIAAVRSAPLEDVLTRQNVSSINQDAETLSKLLATDVSGKPGSIARGADFIEAWANARGADVRLHDASGLSYANRVTTGDMATLLNRALRSPWGNGLRTSLAVPGEGTLGGRLAGLEVRAKTGTLIGNISALSGYVRLHSGRWASFSIMSELPKDEAVALEDAIVRAIAANA